MLGRERCICPIPKEKPPGGSGGWLGILRDRTLRHGSLGCRCLAIPATATPATSHNAKLSRGHPSASVLFQFIIDSLTFTKARQSGGLQRRDVHEYIFAASARLQKAKTSACVEPFHRTDGHRLTPKYAEGR